MCAVKNGSESVVDDMLSQPGGGAGKNGSESVADVMLSQQKLQQTAPAQSSTHGTNHSIHLVNS